MVKPWVPSLRVKLNLTLTGNRTSVSRNNCVTYCYCTNMLESQQLSCLHGVRYVSRYCSVSLSTCCIVGCLSLKFLYQFMINWLDFDITLPWCLTLLHNCVNWNLKRHQLKESKLWMFFFLFPAMYTWSRCDFLTCRPTRLNITE